MKDLGDVKKILGMEIQQDILKGIVDLSQKANLQKVLWHFSMNRNIKSISTLLASHFKLNVLYPNTDEEKRYMYCVSTKV